MMAAGPTKSSARLFAVTFFSLVHLGARASATMCVDGAYEHDGRQCCLCGAGLQLVEHCTTNLQYGKCVTCASGTYSSHPTNQMFCEPCTSCSHPNDNLEVDEPCSPARDTKCRCQKAHYCVSFTEICKQCHPCKKCGDEGIKVDCKGISNTVCNDKIEGASPAGKITSIIIGIGVFIAAVVGLVVFLKKRTTKQPSNENAADVEMQHLTVPDVELQPHLSDIAEVIGWKDMQMVAIRSSMSSTIIESCKMNYPTDNQEATLQLLQTWVERQGKIAGKKLIEILQNAGKRGKAEKVTEILSHES